MRAGALSLAETALFGRPCVLIPYPFAADRHQERNAEEFCAAGGGILIRQEEASAEAVGRAFSLWAEEPGKRKAAVITSYSIHYTKLYEGHAGGGTLPGDEDPLRRGAERDIGAGAFDGRGEDADRGPDPFRGIV